MGKVVNLTKARKARSRAADSAQAVQNRIKHGLTKAQRAQAAAEAKHTAARLNGAKREPDA